MNIERILHGKIGKIFMSVLLGLGLATLFRKVCNDRNCIVFKAPNIKKIQNQIFKFQDKCYTFTENIEKCNNNRKIVNFA